MNVTIDDLHQMRGVSALTQGEIEVEEMLVRNVNMYGNKRIGFNQTRLAVLKNTSREDLMTYVNVCLTVGENMMMNNSIMMGFRHLTETILRDHVTNEMAKEFKKNVHLRVSELGKQMTVNNIERFLKKDKLYSVPKVYLKIKEENAIGEVIYNVIRPPDEFQL